ncbi:MAG TPA: septum site-determining protein MinC [Gammaproteobacteria bacterium]|nr:septum site-determining protein MinC [Gammaproteobacteria bacterium]
METQLRKAQTAFLLKGGAYTFTTLQLISADIETIRLALVDKIAQAPKFFEKTPIVLDVQKLETAYSEHDLRELLQCLRKLQLIPIGIRGANELLQQAAIAQGIACLSDMRTQEKNTEATKASPQEMTAKVTATTTLTNKVITQPVRSGQQIYAQGGDLIVLATVSHGAEILADGNIHVYAPLRGRALAGVMGDTNTYIFCQSLEAELVSVAGQYRISEQLKESGWQKPAQISLSEGHLRITAL